MLDPELVTLLVSIFGIGGTLTAVVLTQKLANDRWRNEFFLREKVKTFSELLVALMESHRAVHQRTMFGEGMMPAALVDAKIETTIAKFNQASPYLDDADYKIMDNAWITEKRFISLWMHGEQVDLKKDVDDLNSTYKTAYDRLRTLVRSP